ncbi:RxLR-like protein [Plasmopara halstedii]|uniref:Secreted RxLR effector protein RXLR-C22 n=1 Tax=Plasmopara halstedii TaxID=4781 RepID=RLR24_PLAHL|nr:RxLR-like protein [Plasmopara halstedii]A0A0P1AK67.1 RecName: Full=Secreted RxLR effector protein RXLR-C22; Flags: Precursor [Plasmopara halstedii]CEG41472.1 RxLR-like protein [Plasmopara halstedii]|eukprot:XP_024577841.1 RxLR-like protein [Plasmopara halstedii]
MRSLVWAVIATLIVLTPFSEATSSIASNNEEFKQNVRVASSSLEQKGTIEDSVITRKLQSDSVKKGDSTGLEERGGLHVPTIHDNKIVQGFYKVMRYLRQKLGIDFLLTRLRYGKNGSHQPNMGYSRVDHYH